MNTSFLRKEMDTYPAIIETEALIHHGFSPQEISALVRLREKYENRGSDRGDVVRHLEFLVFLLRTGKLRAEEFEGGERRRINNRATLPLSLDDLAGDCDRDVRRRTHPVRLP